MMKSVPSLFVTTPHLSGLDLGENSVLILEISEGKPDVRDAVCVFLNSVEFSLRLFDADIKFLTESGAMLDEAYLEGNRQLVKFDWIHIGHLLV